MRLRRTGLLAASIVFVATFAAHGWFGMYGAVDEVSSRWVELESPGVGSRLAGYLSGGGIWLGYCYAISAGFAAWTAVAWYSRRGAGAKAVGGFSLSGAIAATACFFTGCCGSPMLGVWVGLLGASAAPWLGPFAALVSTLSLLFAAFLMRRGVGGACDSGKCDC